MPAKVSDLMTAPARTVAPDDSLFHAAEVMWSADCGGLPVVDAEGRLTGFVTDRDITMCAAIQGRTLHEMPVSAAMTFDVLSVKPADGLSRAHECLRTRRVHRLPVVDEQGAVVGLLSLADLARDAAAHPKARTSQSELRSTVVSLAEPWERTPADERLPSDDGDGVGGKATKRAKRTAASSTAKVARTTKSASSPARPRHVKKAAAATPARGTTGTRGSGASRGRRGGGRSASAGA